jgi:hypothetical protein
VRVEAVDLVDDGHGRDGGVVGAGEQVPCRRELAPLRYVLWRTKPNADGTASATATTRHRNPAHS